MAMKVVEVLLLDSTPRTWDTWISPPFLTIRKIVFISWKLPPLAFLKVNFDGNITDGIAGIGFVIWGSDSRLIVAEGVWLVDTLVSGAELRAA